MADGDIFVGVFHYQRDISRTHGVPFKFLVKKVCRKLTLTISFFSWWNTPG